MQTPKNTRYRRQFYPKCCYSLAQMTDVRDVDLYCPYSLLYSPDTVISTEVLYMPGGLLISFGLRLVTVHWYTPVSLPVTLNVRV